MRITVNPPKSEWADLLRRPQIDAPVIGERVAAILERVRAGGDRAVLDLTAEIDSVALDSLEVAPEEIERPKRPSRPNSNVPSRRRPSISNGSMPPSGLGRSIWKRLPACGVSSGPCRSDGSGSTCRADRLRCSRPC